MKISHKLKMEIISNYKGVNIEQRYEKVFSHYKSVNIPLYQEIVLFLDLSNETNLFEECQRWFEMIINNYSIETKINIGPFMGLFPTEIDINNNTVTFRTNIYDSNNQTWKDWFLIEEEENLLSR